VTDLSAFSLEGRTILVTGANTGIGQGIAVAVARAGGHVLAVARSSLDQTASQVADVHGTCDTIHCDLSDLSSALSMLETAWSKHGPIHGLVNNAGIIRRADSTDLSETDWDEVIDLNLKATFFLCQAYGKLVFSGPKQGKIVNIASLLSFQGGIRVASYTASKHGVAGITQILCNEWAGKGININAIAPGYIESNNTEALRADPDRSASILSRIPAARWGRPSDIGDAAVFLLSNASNYMHGAIVPVDGGWLAR
jgi:2-dehydro-3-deoxy-D-gluconate 5-dehydrogenase